MSKAIRYLAHFTAVEKRISAHIYSCSLDLLPRGLRLLSLPVAPLPPARPPATPAAPSVCVEITATLFGSAAAAPMRELFVYMYYTVLYSRHE